MTKPLDPRYGRKGSASARRGFAFRDHDLNNQLLAELSRIAKATKKADANALKAKKPHEGSTR